MYDFRRLNHEEIQALYVAAIDKLQAEWKADPPQLTEAQYNAVARELTGLLGQTYTAQGRNRFVGNVADILFPPDQP